MFLCKKKNFIFWQPNRRRTMKQLQQLDIIKLGCLVLLLMVFVRPVLSGGKISADQQQIIKLEKNWLALLHSRPVLDTILAPDFIHPVSQGIFLTKDQHINWAVNHPDLTGNIQKFDTLLVRVYENVGIANGIVVTFNMKGKLIRKSIFTDVFIKRNDKWQAVNAQENLVH